ncbi:MAG: IS66 family insertion sequence element accessory protein TnpB [Bacteroidales bacterium]|nr:IS66 family insertion sequence element accessory protein TnpB [Bacteroidales bacterium]
MFSLDNTMRYWLYSKPVNMRMGFNGLSGIVGMSMRSGDVFVFINAARNRMKILHREDGGLVLYALRIEMGRMCLPFSGEPDEIASSLCYADLISAARSALVKIRRRDASAPLKVSYIKYA